MSGRIHGGQIAQPRVPGRVLLNSRFPSSDGQIPDLVRWNPNQSSGGAGSVFVSGTDGITATLQIQTGSTAESFRSIWVRNKDRWPTNTSLLTLWSGNSTGGNDYYFVMRAQDYTGVLYPPNCYTIRWTPNSLSINKVVAGAPTSLGSFGISLTANAGYWIRFELKGALLTGTMWLDTVPEPAPQIRVYDDTWGQGGACLASARCTGASSRTLSLGQYILYVPQEMSNPLAQIFAPILSTPVIGISRDLATEVDIASDAEAAIVKTARYLVKPNTSTSVAASPVFNRGLVSNVSSAFTPIAGLSVGGTVSFTATISETKNLRLKRVAAPDVSGLPRAYQAAVPGSTMVRPMLRRTVRRTGKMATSTSGRASLSYGKSFTLVGSILKPRFSISAKAVLSTTTTAQGNAPAIPPTLPNGIPASKMIGTGSYSVGTFMTPAQWATHKSKGWGGFAGPMYNRGGIRGKNSSAQTETVNTAWTWQRANEGWQEPGVNANPPVSQIGPNTGAGPRNVKLADSSFNGYFSSDILPYNNWFDDVEAAAQATKWGEWAAACVYLGLRGTYSDNEAMGWGTSTNRPGSTRAQALAKIEQRGYEVGLKIYAANPAFEWNIYSPVPSGTVFDRIYNSPNGTGLSSGTTGNRDPTYTSDSQSFYCWILGMMTAGAQLGSTGCIYTLDHRNGYRDDGLRGSTVQLVASQDDYAHASWMGMISRMSGDLAPAVRDHWMGKFGYRFFSWSDTSCGGPNDYYYRTQQSAAVYNAAQTRFRRWSADGMRFEYTFTTGHPNGAAQPCSQWTLAGYANAYDAVPGRTAHYQQMALTTPQDVMTVSGAPAVGTFNVTATGRGGGTPTVGVPLELTATLINQTLDPINNPGVGFYTVPGNINVGWAASGAVPLPAGQSRTYSTLTSPQRSQYIPSAAGTVTLRAKPGNGGVDSDIGTRDQTFTVAAAPPPVPGARPFISTSSWNTPVPAGATFTDRPELRTSNWWFDASDFGIVVYTSTPSDPLVTVSIPFNSWNWPISSTQIRIASGVDGAEGSDGTLCVVSGTDVWDFWQFNRLSDTTAECSASAHTSITTGTGWSLGGGQAAGIRSAGCSSLAGLIQGNTLTNGFDHALAIALRFELVSSAMVRDAISSDGQGPGSAIPMGTRLAIPPNVPRPGSVTSSIAINIWNACKTYGVYVVDTMGGGTVGGFAGNVNTVTQAQSDILLNAGVWNSPELTAIGHALQLVNL